MAQNSFMDFLQGASNSAASNLSAPIDGINWLLRKAGLPVSEAPVGGSDWMAKQGLTAQPQNRNAGLLGEAFGGVLPIVAAAKAPQIAKGLLQGADNLAAPTALNSQAGVVSVDLAKKLNTKMQLPSDDLFAQAVANTPGANIGDDGLRMSLTRNQRPEQAMAPSVRGGVFYLPEGSSNAKFYSGKNENYAYGGSEKVTGETLIANPLFTKGATGGKAPQTAYDSLMGKGAYEKMRGDVLHVSGMRSIPKSLLSEQDKVEELGKLLAKYGAPTELAPHILKNSTKGNQFPYAVQEAIVGSAVRNAGHDAVLGYSKGKNGPFISEVFDVRESHYPDKFGGSEVWGGLLK